MRSAAAALALAALGVGCGPKAEPGAGPAAPTASDRAPADAGAGDKEAEAKQIAAIAHAVNEFSRAVHTCWAVGAADDFRLEGKVVLALSIGPGGGSTDVEVVSDEPKDPRLTHCLVGLWSDYTWPAVFEQGDKIQLPPFDFVAPAAQYTVSAAHVEQKTLAGGKLQVSVVLDRKNTGNDSAALSILRASGGLAVPLHKHPSAELIYVLSGAGATWGARGEKRAQEVGPGSAVYIPAGAPHAFRQSGEEPLVVLQLYTPAGPEQRFLTGDSAGTEPVDPAALRHRRRFPHPRVRPTDGAPTHPVAGGKGKVAILFDAASAGDGAASLGALTLQPGASLPRHLHDKSSVYLFVLEGAGQLYVGDDVFPVQAGDAVQVPPGTEHAFVAGGEEPVKAIQYFTPAGPEQPSEGEGPR